MCPKQDQTGRVHANQSNWELQANKKYVVCQDTHSDQTSQILRRDSKILCTCCCCLYWSKVGEMGLISPFRQLSNKSNMCRGTYQLILKTQSIICGKASTYKIESLQRPFNPKVLSLQERTVIIPYDFLHEESKKTLHHKTDILRCTLQLSLCLNLRLLQTCLTVNS